MITYWSYSAETGVCVMYGRDPHNTPVFETTKLTFQEGHDLSRAFDAIYRRGVEDGEDRIAQVVRDALGKESPQK